MPELVEVESYRRAAEERALGRMIAGVDAGDAWYLKGGLDAAGAAAACAGRCLVAARRRGKLLLLDIGPAPGSGVPGGAPGVVGGGASGEAAAGPVLGVRFGMTGRLLVDGLAGIDRLLYSPANGGSNYDRFGLRFADGGCLIVSDPRRLGGVEIDPDEDRLGPDALTITPAALRAALGSETVVALKTRLMDQARLAGVGNLIADEVLWRASLAPSRPAGSLSVAEARRLHRHLTEGLAELVRRGGSHTGDLQPQRHPGGRCTRDGAPLARLTIGGRTTWWCPAHQA